MKHTYPFPNARISASDFRTFAKLESSIVISTACSTGTQAFADTMLACGASAYLAPADCPDADSALVFVNCFLYAVRKSPHVDSAFQYANGRLLDKNDEFKIWTK